MPLNLSMKWNASVMRKFATTSHTRLIHQLLGELHQAAVVRQQKGPMAAPSPVGQDGNVEHRTPLPSAGEALDGRPAAKPSSHATNSQRHGDGEMSGGFRDRLNAVKVR